MNHVDGWCEVPNRWMTIKNTGVGCDGGVDGPFGAWGASRGWQSRQRGRKGCKMVLSNYYSKYYVKYCKLQHCVVMCGPNIFAGPSLVCEPIATCERLWKDVQRTKTTKEVLFC